MPTIECSNLSAEHSLCPSWRFSGGTGAGATAHHALGQTRFAWRPSRPVSADILIIFLTFALVGFCWFGVGSDFANLIGESKGSHSSSSSSGGSSKGSSSSKFQSSKFQSSSFQSSSFQSSSFQSFNLQSSKVPRNSPKVKNSTRGTPYERVR